MLKTVFLAFITLSVAIGGGAASAWYALDTVDGLGALEIGAWTAYPDTGTERADPYSAARASREAELPLGRSEGLEFVAHRDSAGDMLDRGCAYRIEGPAPAARFFTLYAADANGRPIRGTARRAVGLASWHLLRLQDGVVSISIDARPAPGNWLAIGGQGPMSFVLTLYDTPIASNSRIEEIALPQVVKTGCAA